MLRPRRLWSFRRFRVGELFALSMCVVTACTLAAHCGKCGWAPRWEGVSMVGRRHERTARGNHERFLINELATTFCVKLPSTCPVYEDFWYLHCHFACTRRKVLFGLVSAGTAIERVMDRIFRGTSGAIYYLDNQLFFGQIINERDGHWNKFLPAGRLQSWS